MQRHRMFGWPLSVGVLVLWLVLLPILVVAVTLTYELTR